MTSEIKVNKVSDSCGSALVTKCGANITLGASGKTVRIACGASTVGMGRTGTVDWCTTAKTSPFTSENGKGYFVNTTSGTITVTLPASPTAGQIVAFKDYAETWDTNKIVLCRNGSKLNGICGNTCLTTEGQSVTLIYVDGTKGWLSVNDSTACTTGGAFVTATGGTVLTCGNYKTHVFTSDANFVVSAGQGTKATVDYVVVAGGGGGGLEQDDTTAAGGGGGGGFRLSNSPVSCISSGAMSPLASSTGITVAPGTYPITVGAGGTRAPYPTSTSDCRPGGSGGNSVFSTITSAGGGGGSGVASASFSGKRGGSGGGGKQDNGASCTASSCGSISGGTGNYPPVTPPQGNNGGHSDAGPLAPAPGGTYMSGGGGGAGAVGTPGGPTSFTPQGCGGIGALISTSVFGPTSPSYGTTGPATGRYFSGGGGGGGVRGTPNTRVRGEGGSGGGGYGGSPPSGPNPNTVAANGTTNTGGGGGGGGNRQPAPTGDTPNPVKQGGTGGSGIVILRYKFQ
jgi:hypothetical protein